MARVAAMTIYGEKPVINLLLRNQWANYFKSRYVAFVQMMTLGWPLPIFLPRSNLVTCVFVWEKMKIFNFGNYCCLWIQKLLHAINWKKQIKLHEYQRSGSLLDLRPKSLRYQNYNLFFWKTAEQIEAKFHMKPFLDRGMKVCSNGPGHMAKMPTMTIYGKNTSKIFFSRTREPIVMKLGMKHWPLGPIIVCSEDDPGFSLTILRKGRIWSLMLLYGKK